MKKNLEKWRETFYLFNIIKRELITKNSKNRSVFDTSEDTR